MGADFLRVARYLRSPFFSPSVSHFFLIGSKDEDLLSLPEIVPFLPFFFFPLFSMVFSAFLSGNALVYCAAFPRSFLVSPLGRALDAFRVTPLGILFFDSFFFPKAQRTLHNKGAPPWRPPFYTQIFPDEALRIVSAFSRAPFEFFTLTEV